jgi:hypothetical protein
MKWAGATATHAAVFAEVEALCANVPTLSGEPFAVEFRADFDSLPQAQKAKALLQTPAGYDPSQHIIIINRKTFDSLSAALQKGVLLHELGHAVRHGLGESHVIGDCIEADLAVVHWGLVGAIAEAREATYGAEYGRHLRAAHSHPASARASLEKWAMQVRAGVIALPSRD